MNKVTASLLLENLLDRVELDSNTGKWRLGTLSAKERAAIEFAVSVMGEGVDADVPDVTVPEPTTIVVPPVTPVINNSLSQRRCWPSSRRMATAAET